MNKGLVCTITMLAICSLATAGLCASKGSRVNAKKVYEQHCAVCHPKGGNTINSSKTLGRKALAANGIKSAQDIIAKMRNPGPGMNRFDEKTISNKEAKAIAEYILKTFK